MRADKLCVIQIQATLKGLYNNTVTTEEVPPRNHNSSCESTPEHCVCHVKLPKLSVKKFGGDLMKWTTLWDAFDAAVHSNAHLPNIENLTILAAYLICSKSSGRAEPH